MYECVCWRKPMFFESVIIDFWLIKDKGDVKDNDVEDEW